MVGPRKDSDNDEPTGALFKGRRPKIRPKWPISINFWNIWAQNTVWEIYRKIPLFGVLELGELEYPFFFVHRGTWPSANEI